MVWESGCVVVVMLTPLSENGVRQCYHYWPDEGSNLYHIYEVLPRAPAGPWAGGRGSWGRARPGRHRAAVPGSPRRFAQPYGQQTLQTAVLQELCQEGRGFHF